MGYFDTMNAKVLWETCCHDGCHVTWGMTRAHYESLRDSHAWFYCPNGHAQKYTGKSAEQKLKDAEAREVHLKDQLAAATRNEEAARSELLRVRSRIAAGICPCCRRTFQNVARHMETQHPDFTVPDGGHGRQPYRCSCGKKFDTYLGLRTHQGKSRGEGWERENRYWAHLSVVTA